MASPGHIIHSRIHEIIRRQNTSTDKIAHNVTTQNIPLFNI